MRAFTSFNYWMKRVQQRQPLPPIFDKFFPTDFFDSLSFYQHFCQSETPPGHLKHQKNDQCFSWTSSAETLKDGVDYTGSIYRTRIDVVLNAVHLAVASALSASALLADAGVDAHNIGENMFMWVWRLYLFKWRIQGGNLNTLFTWDGCGRSHWWSNNDFGFGYALQVATEKIFTTLSIKLSHFHHLFIEYISCISLCYYIT